MRCRMLAGGSYVIRQATTMEPGGRGRVVSGGSHLVANCHASRQFGNNAGSYEQTNNRSHGVIGVSQRRPRKRAKAPSVERASIRAPPIRLMIRLASSIGGGPLIVRMADLRREHRPLMIDLKAICLWIFTPLGRIKFFATARLSTAALRQRLPTKSGVPALDLILKACEAAAN
jgi:hypothetical protein